jgi:hypothetical protein
MQEGMMEVSTFPMHPSRITKNEYRWNKKLVIFIKSDMHRTGKAGYGAYTDSTQTIPVSSLKPLRY